MGRLGVRVGMLCPVPSPMLDTFRTHQHLKMLKASPTHIYLKSTPSLETLLHIAYSSGAGGEKEGNMNSYPIPLAL